MHHLAHHLLDAAMAADSRRVAARCGDRSITYGQLAMTSSALGGTLAEVGVRPGHCVGIHLPKGLEMLAALYGVLKAGAAYVPLDPAAPASYVASFASDCDIQALVSTPTRAAALAELLPRNVPAVLVDDGSAPAELPKRWLRWEEATAGGSGDPRVSVDPSDLACIMYTSGSTGLPKGVMHTHATLVSVAEWTCSRFRVEPADRLAVHAPLHFVLSAYGIFPAALAGAEAVIVPEYAFVGDDLAHIIARQRITIWLSVPAALLTLTASGPAPRDLASLRVVMFSGGTYPSGELPVLRELVPRAQLWNLYGSTETWGITRHLVEEMPGDDQPLPIGTAWEGTEVFALREDGAPAGVGEEAEMYVGTPRMMRGYWGDPELTARVLVLDPRDEGSSNLVYRTGDLVRLRPDGSYEFMGRKDDRVKSRGYRIELGEIERALRVEASVADAAAAALPHDRWGSVIVAYVVLRAGAQARPVELKRALSARLPGYMVPESIELVEALPRTSTGKVDRRRLQGLFGA